jgi:hypothetical protein
MKKTSTFGLRLDQMQNLFSLGTSDPDPSDEEGNNEKMAGLLREQLACALPERPLLFDALIMMMEQQGYDTQPLAAKSLSQVFSGPGSDIGLLRAIKECSKTLSCTLDSEVEMALATTVYYAALASALVHHDEKITQNSYEKLDESLALLIGKKWMAEELVALFSQAQRICRNRRSNQ